MPTRHFRQKNWAIYDIWKTFHNLVTIIAQQIKLHWIKEVKIFQQLRNWWKHQDIFDFKLIIASFWIIWIHLIKKLQMIFEKYVRIIQQMTIDWVAAYYLIHYSTNRCLLIDWLQGFEYHQDMFDMHKSFKSYLSNVLRIIQQIPIEWFATFYLIHNSANRMSKLQGFKNCASHHSANIYWVSCRLCLIAWMREKLSFMTIFQTSSSSYFIFQSWRTTFEIYQ